MSDTIKPTLETLTLVTDFEWSDEPYEFDLTRIYHHPDTNQIFYAHDSGCSCPMPFEDFNSIDDYTKADSLQAMFDVLKDTREDKCSHEEYNDEKDEYENHTSEMCPLTFKIVGLIEKLHNLGIR